MLQKYVHLPRYVFRFVSSANIFIELSHVRYLINTDKKAVAPTLILVELRLERLPCLLLLH